MEYGLIPEVFAVHEKEYGRNFRNAVQYSAGEYRSWFRSLATKVEPPYDDYKHPVLDEFFNNYDSLPVPTLPLHIEPHLKFPPSNAPPPLAAQAQNLQASSSNTGQQHLASLQEEAPIVPQFQQHPQNFVMHLNPVQYVPNDSLPGHSNQGHPHNYPNGPVEQYPQQQQIYLRNQQHFGFQPQQGQIVPGQGNLPLN